MKKMIAILAMVSLTLFTAGIGTLTAEDASSTKASLKEQLNQDRSTLKAQRETMKTHAQEAKSEEKALKEQIKTARQAGDKATAQQIRETLKTTHQENVQQKKEDKGTLKAAKRELRADQKIARQTRRGKGPKK